MAEPNGNFLTPQYWIDIALKQGLATVLVIYAAFSLIPAHRDFLRDMTDQMKAQTKILEAMRDSDAALSKLVAETKALVDRKP